MAAVEFSLLLLLSVLLVADGSLYPQNSASREVTPLDGIWNFRLPPKNNPSAGEREQWFKCGHQHGKGFGDMSEVLLMPVPASFNDVTASARVRDFVGEAWYQRHFQVPTAWLGQSSKAQNKIVIRFGGVHYKATVWLNGAKVAAHEGGHLPFEADVTAHVAANNCITVAVNNTLSNLSIPQGQLVSNTNDTERYPSDYLANTYTFDFFNYAGIHRPVHLILQPATNIRDLSVRTTKVVRVADDLGHALLEFDIELELGWSTGAARVLQCLVVLQDADGHSKEAITVPAVQTTCKGSLEVRAARLWWPSGSRPRPGYRHTVRVGLYDEEETLVDSYDLPFGIRTVTWDNDSLFINQEPFYLKGVGRHEDSDIRGKGFDLPLAIKDHNLMKQLGVNGYRTSHYPYAEESLDISEQYGFVVISESPAVNLVNFDDELLAKHKKVMSELISRDKNRACVVMWSLSNEARSFQPPAKKYYKELVEFVKKLDSLRPVTMVSNVDVHKDLGAPFMDILAINRYFSWYSDPGSLQLIQQQVQHEVMQWRNLYKKPLIFSEYGADAISGYHSDPPVMWTEDYQVALLQQNFLAFDDLRRSGNLIGEMVWNFADFQTAQGYKRANGNKKGIYTRDRKPKAAAATLGQRYNSIL